MFFCRIVATKSAIHLFVAQCNKGGKLASPESRLQLNGVRLGVLVFLMPCGFDVPFDVSLEHIAVADGAVPARIRFRRNFGKTLVTAELSVALKDRIPRGEHNVLTNSDATDMIHNFWQLPRGSVATRASTASQASLFKGRLRMYHQIQTISLLCDSHERFLPAEPCLRHLLLYVIMRRRSHDIALFVSKWKTRLELSS